MIIVCGAPFSGFSSLESWSYSKEWMWNLGTKSMLHFVREVKC